MTTIKHGIIDLPAYWASALIDNDWSGIEGTHIEVELRAWVNTNPSLSITGCSDVTYIGRYDGILCDILTYSYTERTC